MAEDSTEKKAFKGKAAKRGKGSKSKFKGKEDFKFKDKLGDDREVYRKGKNDPQWRCNDTVMTKLSANLPFGLGAGLVQHLGNTGYFSTSDQTYRQPGIFVIQTKITAGTMADYNSPGNLAFRKIYSYVRHANSGSKNYEAADMGIYFVAIGQLLAYLGWLQRTLRIVTEYSPTNRYMPTRLLRALYVDPDDLIANQAQLRRFIAWLGRTVGGLAFPDMNYFKACYEAFKYVYKDNDSPKEQFYMLTLHDIGVYNPTFSVTGGAVQFGALASNPLWPKTFSMTPLTVADLISVGKTLTDVLLGDEDCGIISGDILKAFGDGKLFTPQAYAEDYDVFMHSPEVLQQFHNANLMSERVGSLSAISQNPGSANTAPYIINVFNGAVSGPTGDTIYSSLLPIDAFSKDPSPEEVVNCTVLNVAYKLYNANTTGSGAPNYNVDGPTAVFDLFLPIAAYMYTSINPSNGPEDMTSLINRDGPTTVSLTGDKALITNFDWHPLMYSTPGNSQGQYDHLNVIGDIQNFRIFGYDVAVRIHENSILGLLNFQDIKFLR